MLPFGGSSSIRVSLDGAEGDHSRAEQVDSGTAVHRPLQHLEPIDLTFCLTVIRHDVLGVLMSC
jgi:hypothetical protein